MPHPIKRTNTPMVHSEQNKKSKKTPCVIQSPPIKEIKNTFPVLYYVTNRKCIFGHFFIFVSLNPTNYHVGMNISAATLISVIKTTPAQITSVTFFNFLSAFAASSILSENIARNIAGIKNHQ